MSIADMDGLLMLTEGLDQIKRKCSYGGSLVVQVTILAPSLFDNETVREKMDTVVRRGGVQLHKMSAKDKRIILRLIVEKGDIPPFTKFILKKWAPKTVHCDRFPYESKFVKAVLMVYARLDMQNTTGPKLPLEVWYEIIASALS